MPSRQSEPAAVRTGKPCSLGPLATNNRYEEAGIGQTVQQALQKGCRRPGDINNKKMQDYLLTLCYKNISVLLNR